ncbi:MAG: NifU family protein [Clostridiales bacterium]|nr:NifU family protein [Clostridiales bacterium]
MLEKIEKVIEEKVRPSLLSHEGDVQIVDFTDGILRIRLTGQCSGCPSAKLTTEELIGKTVMSEIPEVTDVVLVNEVNPELLDFAKKLLNHRIER